MRCTDLKQWATVVIPAYNEEKRIGQTINALKPLPCIGQVVVVDDGSRDGTSAVARKAGAEVIRLTRNKGKGFALNVGLKQAEGDVVVFLDADVCESSREVQKLVEPILKGEADVTIAVFPPPKKKGGFGLVKGLARYIVRRSTGYCLKAVLSGQRAFRREVLDNIVPIPRGYAAEVGMTVSILKKGYRIKEVPVNMAHRETGRDFKGFLHRGRQFLDILKLCIKKTGDEK